ncbi:50S ribosomal protein L32 [Caviibacter abscessus]|uniref:50S ribosomal protein L32 n=1 Tax=Caviibacter abscessus TaxID=1766719 RepID=UPI000836F1C3|nr:50S ribosomal protein L32 [Caviibacter abscessus]
MAVPKKRTSKAKRNMRRSHDGISAPAIIVEADGTVRRPHRLNLETGLYRGRQIITEKEEKTEE